MPEMLLLYKSLHFMECLSSSLGRKMYVHEFKSLQQIAVLTEAHCSDIEVPTQWERWFSASFN